MQTSVVRAGWFQWAFPSCDEACVYVCVKISELPQKDKETWWVSEKAGLEGGRR